MNDLLKNLDKLRTTELGIMRIRKNLNLEAGDVVGWCGRKITEADRIIKKGKNWYIYYGGSVLTVNARSYTIITAHKIDRKLRRAKI